MPTKVKELPQLWRRLGKESWETDGLATTRDRYVSDQLHHLKTRLKAASKGREDKIYPEHKPRMALP